MIGWIIAGCIILLFVLIFTVHAYITLEMNEDVALSVRVLCFPIRILPAKEKKIKVKYSDYTLKKIRKREEKEAAAAKAKAEKKAKKKAEKDAKKAEKKAELAAMTKEERRALKEEKKARQVPITEIIPLGCKALSVFFSRFFGKLRIRVARIHIKVGAQDAMQAAVLYGVANQGVQYLVQFLKKITNMDGMKKADIQVIPDFLSDKITMDIKLTFRISIGNVLGSLIKAGWKFLVGFLKAKPDPKHPKPSTKAPKPPKAPKAPKIPTPVAPEKRA